MMLRSLSIFTAIFLFLHCGTAQAEDKAILRKILEKHLEAKKDPSINSTEGLQEKGENYQGRRTNETYSGRDLVVYQPSRLPPSGQRPMIVVLHGGMGNALQVQSYLGLDPLADKNGFLVAYLNGTKVMTVGTDNMRGWNAGECCGIPARTKVDDVGYITKTIAYLIQKYGVDPHQVYGMGHSNGAMMTQRLMCETDIYRAAIPVSGPLEIATDFCPAARGKHILAIHGANDQNVPYTGGHGKEAVNRAANYRSQDYTKNIFERSGADYQLVLLDGATHNPESINDALIKTTGQTLPQTIVRFFKLDQ